MRLRSVLLAAACLCLGGAGRGSVDGLADGIAERVRVALGERARTADVRVAVAAPWPKLASDLSALVIAKLRAGGVRSVVRSADPPLSHAQRLVRIELEVRGGTLRASGALYALASPLWGGEPELTAHLFAEAPLDDELRAYLPPTGAPVAAAAAWQARTLPLGDLPLLAVDVGDLDGDGRAELAGATAGEVIVWGLEGGRAIERWRVKLDGRAPPERPRADLATVSVADGVLTAHASGFADGIRRAHGVAALPVHGFSFPGLAGACTRSPGVDFFAAESCGSLAGQLPEKFWSAAGLRRAAGSVSAAVIPGGTLWLRAGDLPAVQLRGVGAQVALASLDRGDVVALSEPVEGEPDALVIRSLAAGLPVVHRIDKLPAVRALAAGDLDGDGRIEIVAVVRDDAAHRTELWLVN